MWLWSDLDTAFGYLSSQALFLLSAYLFLSPTPPSPRAAFMRLARKWLRVAPLGLCIRLATCHPALRPVRSWRSAAIPRPNVMVGHSTSLEVDCSMPRCTAASSCVQPLPHLPFGLRDIVLGFPEIADVGWFLEADLMHTAVLTALCALRGLPGGKTVGLLFGSAWAMVSATRWLLALPQARSLFDCMSPGLGPLSIPYFCLNFAIAPLIIWLSSLAPKQWMLPRISTAVGLLAVSASAVPWLLDCAMMQRLGLHIGCYTGRSSSEETSAIGQNEAWGSQQRHLLMAWNLLRMASLLVLQLTLLALLQRRQPATSDVLAVVDRLSFGVTVASPVLIRYVFFGSHAACLEFTPFALLANLLGVGILGLTTSLVLHVFVQVPWEQFLLGAVAAFSRHAFSPKLLHFD